MHFASELRDYDFCTYTALAFTSIHKLPVKSMQSRCIGLPMKPATKEEAARLIQFRAMQCPELRECGLKIARWSADLTELPEVEPPEEFVNRIADNWRSLFQIADLAGGEWPARARAAARADFENSQEGRAESRGAGGLLGAIWNVFAAEVTVPRRLHTEDLIIKLRNLDEGRWLVANKGKAIDEWYLRTMLKDYIERTTEDKKMPPRQWRPPGSAVQKKGYHELHFEDAFKRYLAKGPPLQGSAGRKRRGRGCVSQNLFFP